MGVAVDRTPDVDLNEEPCKLNRGRHMGRRGVESLSFSMCLFVSPPLWCHITFPKTNLQHCVLGDSFLATASKQTDSSLLWCKMRSQYMRKEVGDDTVGFTEKHTVQLGSLCFLMENVRTRNSCTYVDKWRKSLILSTAIISILFAEAAVSTHHSEYLHTFLLPVCSLSFTT